MASTWLVSVCNIDYYVEECCTLQASHSLGHHSKIKNRELRTQNSGYCDWARAQIRQKYMQFDTEKLQVVERMLEKTQ